MFLGLISWELIVCIPGVNSCYWNESTPSVWIIQTSLVTDVNEIVFMYMLFLKPCYISYLNNYSAF